MRRERTDWERLSDNAVLLHLWAASQELSGGEEAGDRLKLMKLAFLAAYPLFRENIKALNLCFYRYKKGPYSVQVSHTWGDLGESRLLGEDEVFFVTEEGMKFSECFRKEVLELEENERVLQVLSDVADRFAAVGTDEIMKDVYEMRCYTLDSPTTRQKVRSVPHYTDFTDLLEEDKAAETLYVPPGWQVTLELTFHPEALRNLQRGIEDTYEERVYGWDALGSEV